MSLPAESRWKMCGSMFQPTPSGPGERIRRSWNKNPSKLMDELDDRVEKQKTELLIALRIAVTTRVVLTKATEGYRE